MAKKITLHQKSSRLIYDMYGWALWNDSNQKESKSFPTPFSVYLVEYVNKAINFQTGKKVYNDTFDYQELQCFAKDHPGFAAYGPEFTIHLVDTPNHPPIKFWVPETELTKYLKPLNQYLNCVVLLGEYCNYPSFLKTNDGLDEIK